MENETNVTPIEETTDKTPEEVIADLRKQLADAEAFSKRMKEANAELEDKFSLYKDIIDERDIRIQNSDELSVWQRENTFKGKMMTKLILYKDTSHRITWTSVSLSLDRILKVVDEANHLKADDTTIRFADQDVDIKDLSILDIFQGAFLINEISDDFSTFDAKRYYPTSCLPLGYFKGTVMPTLRQFEEDVHTIKSLFKYMREVYVSFASLHNTSNVFNVMKECAHKDKKGNFFISKRANADVYFIPYYVEDLNNCLTWNDEYYNDKASKYVDIYFDKFVYPTLKGKRD